MTLNSAKGATLSCVRGLRPILATVVAIAAVGCTQAHSKVRTAPTAGSDGGAVTRGARTVPTGMQRAWMHGVGVDAPASWPRNAVHCGRPIRNTLVVFPSGGGSEGCLIMPPRGLSVVWLGAYRAGQVRANEILGEAVLGRGGLRGLRTASIGGEQARMGTLRSINTGTALLVVFPQRRAYVSIRSDDARLVIKVLDSIQLTNVDPGTNCLVHTAAYDDPKRLPAQPGSVLVPDGPTSVTACSYSDDWLEQTATLGGARLARLVHVLDTAPAPTQAHAPDDWPGCQTVAQTLPTPKEPMALHFSYPNQTRLVVARIVWCTRWQSYVTTGTYTRRITGAILNALPPVWTSYPDPDSMRASN